MWVYEYFPAFTLLNLSNSYESPCGFMRTYDLSYQQATEEVTNPHVGL